MLESNWNDRYRSLGYRYNPFEGLTPELLVKSFPLDERVAGIINKRPRVFQVLGGCGFGKTTILLQLQNYFSRQGEQVLYHLVNSRKNFPNLSGENFQVLLLDEVQKINKEFFSEKVVHIVQENVMLILGSHMDHSSWFPPGINVETLYISELLTARIEKILEISLKLAANDKPIHTFDKKAIEKLLEYSGGSLEKIRAICYELFLLPDLPPVITVGWIVKAEKNNRMSEGDTGI